MKKISCNKGSLISHQSTIYEIIQPLDTETILAKRIEDGHPKRLKINEVTIPEDYESQASMEKDLLVMDEKKWGVARKRYQAIKPLIGQNRTRDDLQKCADSAGVSFTLKVEIKKFSIATIGFPTMFKPSLLNPFNFTVSGPYTSILNTIFQYFY